MGCWETESSEKEGSVMQDKGKGKAEDTSTKNDTGTVTANTSRTEIIVGKYNILNLEELS